MEFPTLGQHCQDTTCKQTDFLPLKCQCGDVYCREHFMEHCLTTGCGLPSAAPVKTRAPHEVFRCSSEACGRGSLHEMACLKCGKHFCIEHRFHPECPEVDEVTLAAKREEFAAPRRQFDQSNMPLQRQITENIQKALQSSAKSKTAAKVQLMRIKQKAMGPKSVPVSDRVYFSVVKPKDLTAKIISAVDTQQPIPTKQIQINFDLKKIIPVFVSKKWSLGRAIDTICDTCSIANDNNMADVNKIRLFRSDGYCLGDGRMDVEIQELLAHDLLLDGDSVIVEYVASDNKLLNAVPTFLNLPVESQEIST